MPYELRVLSSSGKGERLATNDRHHQQLAENITASVADCKQESYLTLRKKGTARLPRAQQKRPRHLNA